jgi:RimJ/RimL family protein N-acetyltransferase
MVLSGALSQTLITSARLTLRAFSAADAAESFAEANARIAKYMSWNPPASAGEYQTIWKAQLFNMKAGRELSLVIRLTSTNEFIGRAGLHPANSTLLETGIWIKESAQGRGFGREAVAAVIKWASETFHPSGFLYPVVDENIPSRRLAEALGGEIIGTRHRQKAGDKDRKLLLYRIPGLVRLCRSGAERVTRGGFASLGLL